MKDRTETIFGNPVDKKTVRKAERSRKKYVRRYGDDSGKKYFYTLKKIPALDFAGVQKLELSDGINEMPENPLIVGNIRMGFGHYRISIAIASCAAALGYTPCWLDLAGLDTVGAKIISKQNELYSLASRISQKSELFNRFVWEPLNSEGFRKLNYNAVDQKVSELFAPALSTLPKEVPFVATHVWPSQAAVHAGMKHVVNAVPDNWPLALHLSEGAIHAVQTPFAYFGYKTMNGFADTPLKGIPEKDIKMTGRFVDHELLVDLEGDNERRIRRANGCGPMRFLLTVGGAGAGFDQFLSMIKHLIPYVKERRASVIINFGDHRDAYIKMHKELGNIKIRRFFDRYDDLKRYAEYIKEHQATGITAIVNKDIFEAVYATNLLMPVSDILITKPSELAYYPIPKIFMKHIGGHEVYGAICSREAGDGTFECETNESANAMIDRMISDPELFIHMCKRINEIKSQGGYNGAYECVRLAAKGESK